VTGAVPGLLCTLPYSCPTGCRERDTQELQRDAGHSLSSPRFNSQPQQMGCGDLTTWHMAPIVGCPL